MGCTPVYMSYIESLSGVDPSRIHRMGSTLGTCMKSSFVHHNLFHKKGMHFARARVSMGLCCSNLGRGYHPNSEVFLVDRGLIVKLAIFASLCKI